MKKAIFAVCDPEKEYAHNFMEYLNQNSRIPMKSKRFLVWTLWQNMPKSTTLRFSWSQIKPCARVRELDVGKLMILSEGFTVLS